MKANTDNQSPDQIARANRLLFAKEEGTKAVEEVQREAVRVRKNMARLRDLRLAKEADTVRQHISAAAAKAKPKKRP
jgi:hypothetical protein